MVQFSLSCFESWILHWKIPRNRNVSTLTFSFHGKIGNFDGWPKNSANSRCFNSIVFVVFGMLSKCWHAARHFQRYRIVDVLFLFLLHNMAFSNFFLTALWKCQFNQNIIVPKLSFRRFFAVNWNPRWRPCPQSLYTLADTGLKLGYYSTLKIRL